MTPIRMTAKQAARLMEGGASCGTRPKSSHRASHAAPSEAGAVRPAPRYDEVYANGTAWLDREARGEHDGGGLGPPRGVGRAGENAQAKTRPSLSLPLAGFSEARFLLLAMGLGGEPEYPISGKRFDLAWPEIKLALEVQGLYGRDRFGRVTHAGGHRGIAGYRRDMAKYSEAAILGWRILYCTPEELRRGKAAEMVRRALG